MGVDVRVDGVPVRGASGVGFSEDSTPLDPSDSFGGVGSVSFTVPAGAGAKSMLGATVELTDSVQGTVAGVVAALSGDRARVKVDAHARTVALVAKRTALPHVGTLESCLLYYFGLCGVTSGVVIDESVADVEVVAPGWFGNVWEMVTKKFAPAYQVEIAVVGDDIVVRPPRTVTAVRVSEQRFEWSTDKSQLAQTVEAVYYPCAEITDALVVGNELSPVSNIDAGELYEFTVPLDASLASVVQPVAANSVAFDSADASEYAVLDQFDQPVTASYWRRNGGRVTVEISDDTRSLRVTVVGCQERSRAPYRLAAVAADGSEYSTLRVIGSGVSVSSGRYVLPAATDASDEVGAEVDNLFLGSWGHAHLALLGTAGRFGSASQRVSGSARRFVTGEVQAFGNLAGARVFDDYNVYRVRSAWVDPPVLDVAYEAVSDVTFADTTGVNEGHTIADWNDLWESRPISEYNLRPLTPLSGEVTPPTGGLYPGLSTYPSSSTFPGA